MPTGSCAGFNMVNTANFGEYAGRKSNVRLPFTIVSETLGMPVGVDSRACELISGEVQRKELSPDTGFTASVAAHGAAIWKISHDRVRPLLPGKN